MTDKAFYNKWHFVNFTSEGLYIDGKKSKRKLTFSCWLKSTKKGPLHLRIKT